MYRVDIGVYDGVPNRVQKEPHITYTKTYNDVQLNQEFELMTPYLLIQDSFATFTKVNYLRLWMGDQLFYYYIADFRSISKDLTRIELSLDSLMTYQDFVLNGIGVFVDRASDVPDSPDDPAYFAPDPMLPISNDRSVFQYEFTGNGFDPDPEQGSFILITAQDSYADEEV